MIPRYIIIHHSLTKDGETVSWQAIRQYHLQQGWYDIGYHAGIERIGNIYEVLLGRMFTERGAHCTQVGMNSQSLGICCVGNFDEQDQVDDFTARGGLRKLIDLTIMLQSIFRIPTENLMRHSDFAHYKTCPGRLFPWDQFKHSL